MGRLADQVQVGAAFALPVVLVAVAGWFAWSETWNRAEGELSRTADGAAELADRVFSSALLAARLTNTVLSGVSDADIQQDEIRYHEQLASIVEELPGSNMISVSDRDGFLRIMSGQYPAPHVSVGDREWVRVLQGRDPPDLHIGPLSVGRVAGKPFFSISVPRTGSGNGLSPETYDGNITVSLDPHEIAQELRTTTQEDADVIALVREDGAILASTRGDWAEAPAVPPNSPLLTAIGQGATRGMYEGRTLGLRDGLPLGRGLLIAFKQVGTLPVYTTVSRTPMAIIAPWMGTMTALLAVGLPTSLALGLLSLTSLHRRNALGKSEAELRAAFENAATGTALVDIRSNRILKVNKRLCEISGRKATDLIGTAMDRLLHPRAGNPDGRGPEEAEAAGTLCRLERPDGGARWIELGMAPVTSSRIGEPSLMIATLHDVTERKESEDHQILLAREVDHRAKNVLAIVQAVVRLERRSGATSYVDKIEGRIRALARAHELLARDRWEGASLRELVEEELAAYGNGTRIAVDGPDTVMSAEAVQPLSMVLHELATNAIKHGALSRPEGRLSVSWAMSAETGGLGLAWHEDLEAEATAPSGAGGSGLTIIHGSVEQLGGEVLLDWRDGGLKCRLVLPPAAVATAADPGAVNTNAPPGAASQAGPASLAGLRVLLAEDEVLVAMDVQEILERIGCEVIGPAHSLEEATRLADLEAGRIDAAVLDVNLKKEVSVGLARELLRTGVAVLLLTGYSEVPGRLRDDDWAQLRKPVSEADLVQALERIGARTRGPRARADAPSA